MNHFDNIDLVKGTGGYKYVKRTGSPGNYKYWYKMPDGTLSTHQPDSQGHKQSQKEHARRLILGWVHGVHSKSKDEMAKELGIPKRKFEEIISNLAAAARRRGRVGSREEVLRQKEVDTEALQEAAGQAEPEAPQDTEGTQIDPRMFEFIQRMGMGQSQPQQEPQGDSDAAQTPSVEASPRKKKKKKVSPQSEEIKRLREQLKREHGLDLGSMEDEAEASAEEPKMPKSFSKILKDGFKVEVPGESQGLKAGGWIGYSEWYQQGAKDKAEKNFKDGVLDVGFKYISFENGEKAVKDLGFKFLKEAEGQAIYVNPKTKVIWSFSRKDGVGTGGFSQLFGPHKETLKLTNQLVGMSFFVFMHNFKSVENKLPFCESVFKLLRNIVLF